MSTEKLSPQNTERLLHILGKRFEANIHRHKDMEWSDIQARIASNPLKLWSLNEMEITGGEPDVVSFNKSTGEYTFFDCSPESPKGRRSICYDQAALEARKKYKPENSAMNMASEMGIEILNEAQYRQLQNLGTFDTKTSSWLLTPAEIRGSGGAIFGDWRYGSVFIYHNGAESYYASRGFRGCLTV